MEKNYITQKSTKTQLSTCYVFLLVAFLFMVSSATGQTIRYVKQGGSGNGLAWATASGDFQATITASSSGDEVWVAAGEYQPASGQSFSMKEGVKIYGGFASTGTPVAAERNWVTNITVLKGNGKRVVYNNGNGLTNAAVLDGFTVMNGSEPYVNGQPFQPGAGIYNSFVSPLIINCTIKNNYSDGGGSGIANISGAPKIVNCVIHNNAPGATYDDQGSAAEYINVTIANNSTGGDAGGMLGTNNAHPTAKNCIIWGNSAGNIGSQAYFINGAYLTATNCVLQNTQYSIVGTVNGTNMIYSDPLFVNAGSGNYRLQNASPAINTGNNSYFTNAATSYDFDGAARIFGAIIDLGPFENTAISSSPILYVKQGASGTGASWADASGDLQATIDIAVTNRQIWVAAGEYQQSSGVSFSMKEGVKIYGGFPATGNPEMADRNWAANNTTLKGNSNRVINNSANNLTNAAVLDGFTITNGNVGSDGGGMLNENSYPTITNCIFHHNNSFNWGGAILNRGNGSAKISNTLFYANTASGGGAAFDYSNATPQYTNVTFANNNSSVNGGAIHTYANATSTLRNCIVWGNTAAAAGSQLYSSGGSVTSSYSLIPTGAADVSGSHSATNNISGNPLFTDAANGDFTLSTTGSAAIDAGNTSLFADAAIAKDLAGNPRIYNEPIDMGAYEAQQPLDALIRYVKVGGTGNGNSWAAASGDLQAMINAAASGTQVWVAKGTYQPAADTSFSMKDGVKIYGGFNNTGTPTMADRNWRTQVTTLQGNNSSVVYNASTLGLSSETLLDGFTITGGVGRTDVPGAPGIRGGGIMNHGGSAVFNNLIIANNAIGSGSGGGVMELYSSSSYSNITLSGNSATFGGGLNGFGSNLYLTNILAYSNTTNGEGSAMSFSGGNITLLNSTITKNQCASNTSTGGVFFSSNAGVVKNCVMWGNTNNAGASNLKKTNASVNVASSLIGGSGGSTAWNTALGTNDGNNLDTDPLFTDATANNFTLTAASPAKDAGNTDYFSNAASSTDIAGDTRLFSGIIDMGAYENQTAVSGRYVRQGGTGNGIGWANATGNLQQAIDVSVSGNTVWVAAGDYQPASGQSFSMKEGVKIYGGFPATGNPVMNDRNWNTYETKLNGNGSRVIINNGLTTASVLDGFTIQGGSLNNGATGAGIKNGYASPTLSNLKIRNNTNTGNGGGIANISSSPVISYTEISGNTASEGAGISNYYSAPQLTNVIIRGNHATNLGGGMCDNTSTPELLNVTLTDNTDGSGALDALWSRASAPVIKNSIIIGTVTKEGSSQPTYIYSLVAGSGGSSAWQSDFGIDYGNNIDADPGFTDAANSDYSINAGSGAKDAGNTAFYTGAASAKDFAGNPRLFGNSIDIGAYENQANATRMYVKPGGTGNGLSWANATGNFQTAVNTAVSGMEVWVAAGEYQPASGQSFSMKEGVTIYGGFPATGNPGMNDRNWKTNATILKGNNASVVYNTTLTVAAVLDGFTLRDGAGANGGGMYNNTASPTLRNLTIKNNSVSNEGTAMYNVNSSPTITNIEITDNQSTASIIYNNNSNPKIFNALFRNNVYYSGFIVNQNSSPQVINATVFGGSFFSNYNNSHAVMTNTIITQAGTFIVSNDGSSDSVISYSLIKRSSGNDTWNTGALGTDGGNNILQADPIFTDAGNGDYTLVPWSPAVNNGNTAAFTDAATASDFAGNPRLFETVIDMGAFETQEPAIEVTNIRYAKVGATGTGYLWDDAGDLATLLSTATAGIEIWVAAGEYQPASGQSFTMNEGVKIYGGFPATGAPDIDDRDWVANATTLKGNGNSVISNPNALTSATVLDGFTIKNGSATGGLSNSRGGGINNLDSSAIFRNLVISDNYASVYGGGISLSGAGTPQLINVTIDNNTAVDSGGGVYSQNSNPVYINVIISNNSGKIAGVSLQGGTSTFINSTIAHNASTSYFGGAINCGIEVTAILRNSIIWGNTSILSGSITENNISRYDGNMQYEYSLIQGSGGSGAWNTEYGTDNGNNVDGDPAFTNAENGNYTPLAWGAAFDAGSTSAFTDASAETTDNAGQPRFFGTSIDIGAYESQEAMPVYTNIKYVKQGATGNGTSWADASGNLNGMIGLTTDGDQVWVAEGTYQPGSGTSFSMKEGVGIYGGFAATGNPAFEDRNSAAYITVLDGNNNRVINNNNNGVTNNAVLDGFTIQDGATTGNGAGISNVNTHPVIINCIFKNNTAQGLGGAMYNEGVGVPVVQGSLFYGNRANKGGAVYHTNNGHYTNVTFADNTATGNGGVFFSTAGTVTLKNSILWGNTAGTSGNEVYTTNTGNIVAYYSLLENNVANVVGNNTFENMADSDPLFTDAANGDYTLQAGSPAFNTGNTADFADAATATDLAGNIRLSDYVIDMGAYERYIIPTDKYYVKEGAAGNGTSWADASGDLQAMIDLSNAGGEVWVAKGQYQPSSGQSFSMKEGVMISGGFPDSGDPTPLDRDWKTNPTTLMGNGNRVISNLNNFLTAAAKLDGFHITGGNATSGNGGGIQNVNSSPTLVNLNILSNSAQQLGGGIYNYYASPVMTNCVIADNHTSYGGGMYNDNASPVMTNCYFSQNEAGSYGGGMVNTNDSAPFIINSTIYNNISGIGSEMVNIDNGNPILTNVTMAAHPATDEGIDILRNTNSSPKFYNSIIWGTINNTGTPEYYNSIVKGSGGSYNWNTAEGTDGGGNIDANPLFTDAENYDLTLQAYSQAINAGNITYFTDAQTSQDLSGNPRVFGASIDIGAYERQDAPALVRYVMVYATGNGTSWADASGNLQAMINASDENGTVWVAAGTYQLQDGTSFILKNSVDIYGGFPATGDPVMDDRNWAANPTTLLGNNATVVTADNLTDASTLDGFTITGGNGILGGGIMLNNAAPLLNNLAIRGNTAQNGGGLYFASPSDLTIKSSLIVDNTAQMGGGAYMNNQTNLINVTIAGNTADDGGGLYFNGANGNLKSSIVWGNTSADNASDNVFGGAAVTYFYSLIEGSGGSMAWQSALGNDGTGNVDGDPLFTDANAGDYSIGVGSAAANGGFLPALPDAATLIDAAGNPRLKGLGLDMGAYELQDTSTIRFVKQGGSGDGTSWAAASGSVQQMVSISDSGDEIRVAAGTYPDSTINLRENIEVYGGFPASGGPVESRDWIANETILQNNNNNAVVSNQIDITATAVLDGFTITGGNNSGVRLNNASPTLSNLKIKNNAASEGAGMYINDGSPLVTNVVISNNASTSNGGGVNLNGTGSPVFKNVAIVDNTAGVSTGGYGGGIFITGGGSSSFINVTIAGNASYTAGGIYCSSSAVVQNSIIAGNTGTDDAYSNLRVDGGSVSVSYTLVEGIEGSTAWQSQFGTDDGNNIIASPSFTNAAAGDYTLRNNSPAINTGNDAYFADAASTTDILGNQRLFGTIDMGAYETTDITGVIRYVRVDGTGDGTSWDTASGDLQGMMNASAGTQVWVAAGTYSPNSNTSFTMYSGVKVYGGFPATGYPALNDRNSFTNITTIAGNGESVIKNDNNGLTASAVLDGFFISGGNSTYGGGIFNYNASPTLSNLIVIYNAAMYGGGIWQEGGNALLINTLIITNSASNGGGMYLKNANGTVLNSTISNNSADTAGAEIYLENASPAIKNSIVWNYLGAEDILFADGDSSPVYSYSLVKNSGGSAAWNTTYGVNGGGNLDTDPLLYGNYATQAGSPAQNAGNTAYFANADIAKDIAGNNRLYGNAIDMGVYETFEEALIRYVKVTANGLADGSSWANSSNDLQAMIDASVNGGQVWVAQGTYQRANTDESFMMKEGVKIYGGFPLTGDPTMSDRNWNSNTTELIGHDASVIYNDDNQLTVAAVLDGFTIRSGYNILGAGIYNYNVSPTLNNLKIRGNNAYYGSECKGAGIYEELSNSTITNTIIHNNTSSGMGGAIYFKDSGSTLINVTLSECYADTSYGGLVFENSNVHISNSIIWRNRESSGASNIKLIGTSAPVLTNNLIQGSGGSSAWITGFGTDGGGNIDINPLFVNPGGYDYSLQSVSPAINHGDTALLADAVMSKDLAGMPRVFDTSIDMGAYESQAFVPQTRYVTVTGAGTQDGTSWDNASADIQAMIDLSIETDKVCVAAGEYQRNDGEYYSLKSGVAVYGGFPATGNPTMEDRNWFTNTTSLKGNNNYVIFNDTTLNGAILDGFTITNGRGELAGGIYAYNSNTEFRNLVITGNECNAGAGGGGGITTYLGGPILENVFLTNNTTSFGGGGIYVNQASTTIINSLIADNTATSGGGIYSTGNNLYITNVTITQNTANEGGAIYNDNAYANYYNSIIWDNMTGDGSGNDIYFNTMSGGYNSFYNSLVEGSGGSSGWLPGDAVDSGGNIDADPMFADAAANDFNLQAGSPAANTGNKDYFYNAISSKDIAGNSRLLSSNIDMGAYESTANTSIRYVRQDAMGSGTTWDDASGDLQLMMDASGPGDKVLVATGTYSREAGYSFEMREGVKIYGGFASTGNPSMDDRNWATNLTTLTAGGGVGVIYNGYSGLTPAALLDGFTLTGGGGTGTNGGGISNYAVSPTLSNLIIKGNTGNTGGGIYNYHASPVITNVAIIQNTAYYGGAMSIENSSPVLTNVTIAANNYESYGGSIYNNAGTPIIRNSIIWDKVINTNESAPQYFYSDVKNSGGSSSWNTASGTNGGNNIDADPFLNPDGSIQAGSPASNTGNNSYFANAATSMDLAGNSRVFDDADDIIDMGAYEEQGGEVVLIRYVMEGGTGDGISWATASGDLQGMISASQSTRQVWVAAGNYTPNSNESFSLKEGVKVYGGFPATGTPVMADRNWAVNATLLNGNGSSVIKNDNNDVTNAGLLDGFIIQNGAADNGGGIINLNAYPTIANCIIRNNNAGSSGGGIFNTSNADAPGGTKVINSIFYANTAGNGGAAYDSTYATPEYVNVTFANNNATQFGGGIYSFEFVQTSLKNCIVWGNIANYGANEIDAEFGSTVTASYCIIPTNDLNYNVSGSYTADNTFTTDPIYADIANNNFSVLFGSPAINAANAGYFAGAESTTDIAGNTRVYDGLLDIGAYESQTISPKIYYVKVGGAGTETGLSWTDASADLQATMDNTLTGDKIYVAAGTYQPADDTSFVMKENVKIYGGFPDNGTPVMADRNWAENVTVLSGNGSHVIYNFDNGLTADALLDGFTVSGGTATDGTIPADLHSYGGGILNYNVSPTYMNLVITGNSSTTGGGMHNEQASPKIINSIFKQNNADTGGAMANATGAEPVLLNIAIASNTAATATGMYNDASSPVVNNSIVTDEVVLANGAAPQYAYSLITGSGGSGTWNTAYGTDNGNNVDADPLFTDAANGDFTISDISPAVNAGSITLFANAASRDLGHKVRVRDNAIDMGPYEAQTGTDIRYVKEDAEGSGDGATWADASNDLQEMIEDLDAGGQVWVAEGYYFQENPYIMKEGVAIYGGFPPTGDPVIAERNPEMYTSSLHTYNNIIFNDNNGLTATAILDGFSLENGVTMSNGGGIYNSHVSPTYRNLFIRYNSAQNGGAIYNDNASPTFTNVLIQDNSAIIGSVVYNTASSPVFTNVTIVDNEAGGGGPGGPAGDLILVYNELSSAPVFNNSIIWQDDAIYQNEDDANSTFSYCDIKNSGGSANWDNVTGIDGGNNIDGDPYFTDEYHIMPGSVAINTGNNAYYATAGTEFDPAGNPRLFGTNIDMGAFEEQGGVDAPIRYVMEGGTGDGLSWATAAGNIQEMLSQSHTGNQVWVAGGEYYMEDEESIEMKEGVAIYGGFPATGDPDMTDRNWRENFTVLIGNSGPVIYNAESGLTSAARLDGFVITNGFGYYGGGIYNNQVSPVYANLIITDNYAAYGGGIYTYDSSPTYMNVSIDNNYADSDGSAMYNDNASPLFINVTIADNNGSVFMYNYEAQPVFRNSIIWEDADEIYNEGDSSHAEFAYCILKGSGGSSNWYSDINIDGGHNIDANPYLSDEDYSIPADSPAIDAGENSYFANAAASKDIAGNPRLYGTTIDIGAYEEQGGEIINIRYVREGATGDGHSWATASGDLQDMIDESHANNQVWVAAGTYSPESQSPYFLKDGVMIYGGFAATGSPLFAERDWTSNSTILQGNDAQVVMSNENIASTILDGFTITGGVSQSGGGIFILDGDPTLNNLIIKGNTATEVGGAVGIFYSSPTLSNVLMYGNHSDGTGGAIFNGDDSYPTLINVTIADNTADQGTNTISDTYAGPQIFNSLILGDPLEFNGFSEIHPLFANSLISGSGGSEAWNEDYGTDGGGNLETDPLFTDAANNDYTLQASSPAINAGNDSYFANAAANKDLAGNPRLNGTIDIGAYEEPQPTPVPVTADQLVCTGAHVSDLVATGTDLKWYIAAVGGTPLAATKKVVPGTYYVTQTTDSESERVAVVVTMDHCSTIIAPLCGSTLNKINSSIVAKTVPGATQYRFRISDGTDTVILDKTGNSFTITETSIAHYDQSYSIDVATMIDDDWSGYGALCTLTTPAAAPGIIESLCGTEVSVNTILYAKRVTGATMYRFRITNGANVQTLDRTTYTAKLSMFADYDYNTTYAIDVAVEAYGVLTAYSPACNITLPAVTSNIKESLCGTDITTATQIYANTVPGATQYRFRITNGASVQTIDRAVNNMKFNMLGQYNYGTTYTVDVAVEVDGAWTAYGTACNLTLPGVTTKLRESLCGTNVSTTTQLYASIVTGATQYRFRLTSGATVQTIDRTVNNMKLNMLAQYDYGTTFTVDVAAEVNGEWTAYGTACTITLPLPTTRLKETLCGTTVFPTTTLSANIIPGATQYRFRLTSGANVQTIDRPTYSMKLNMLADYSYSSYTIDVAVEVNGMWAPYGPACTVDAPSMLTRLTQDTEEETQDMATSVNVVAYPNPYSDVFTLEMTGGSIEEINVMVFDITGKQLDNLTIAHDNLQSARIGELYSSGVYTVFVTQGTYQKMLRIVKK
jgi:hypothetical protein